MMKKEKVKIISKGNQKKKIGLRQTTNDYSLLEGDVIKINELERVGLIQCKIDNINITINDEYKMYLLDISDDTGYLTAMLITKDDKDLQKLLDSLEVNDVCLIYCRKSRNPEVVGVFAIKKVNNQ